MPFVLRLLTFSILPILIAMPLGQASAEEERIGLVLSGGGARGVAHVGVIKVLEEMQIPVHAIAGTSMGALVGGLYASGMTAEELEEVVSNIEWEEAFLDKPDREDMPVRRKQDDYDYPVKMTFSLKGGKLRFPLGVVQGQRAIMLLKDMMVKAESIRDFDQLPIPYRAVAADLETGEVYVFSEGDIVRAMRTSMSLPAIFAPVEVEGRLLVDGGIANNLPVDVAQRMGVDRLIVVNIGTPMATRENLNSILSITGQMMTMLTWKNTEEQLANMKPDDLLITPNLEGVSTLDFAKYETAFERGYEAASLMRSSLDAFSVDDESWAQYLASRELGPLTEPRIAFINIQNNSNISDEIIRVRLHQELGEPLDREQLHKDISNIYGLDYFQSVDYDVVERDGTTGIALKTTQKSWGTDNLKLGLNLVNDLNGDSRFNLGVSYRQKEVNKLAAEWFVRAQVGDTILLDGEFYQPLDYKSRFFIAPFIGYRDYDVFILNPLSDKVAPIGRTRVRRGTAEIDMGVNALWNSQIRTAVFHTYGDNRVDSGGFQFEGSDFHEGGGSLTYVYDNLDSAFFPTNGGFFLAEYEANRTWLGSDEDFDRWQVRAQAALSFGKTDAHTTIFTARTQQSIDATLQPQNFYQLGGLFNLSGLSQNVLSGRQLLFGSAQYQYRLSNQSIIPLSMPIYVGASIEAGNTWGEQDEISASDLIASGSLYLAVDSPLGPIYVAYGRTDQDNQAVYLAFGWPFYRQDNVRR